MPKTPIQIRVEEADLANWREKAQEAGQDLSEWIRGRCNGVGGEKVVPRVEPVHLAERSVIAASGKFELPEGPVKPRVRRNDEESTSIAESVAGRTGHEIGCECFQCVQSERFFRAQREK